jgi:hypothetical protein
MITAGLYTHHPSQSFGRGPSGFVRQVFDANDGGVLYQDDFLAAPLHGLNKTGSGAIADAGVVGGCVELGCAATANTATILATGDVIKLDKLTAFEARISKASIANSAGGAFVGLFAGTAGNANPIDGNTGSHDFAVDSVGFLVKDDDGDALIGGARGSGSATASTSTAITADGFVNVGFVFDPANSGSIRFYVDGDEIGNIVGNSNAGDTYVDNATILKAGAVVKATTTAAQTIDIDWIVVAQAS